MKAGLWYGVNDFRISEVDEPFVSPDTVKIKVKWCGICGSDIHEYLAGPFMIPVGTPHPLTNATAPVIMGHEFSGEVVDIGESVTNIKIGDRVAAEPMLVCGKCPACREGKYNLCSFLGCYGLSGGGGGFSEYAVVKQEFVHKLSENVSYEMGAVLEPITVALHSVNKANFKVGQTALVLGSGPIGLATIECLKAAGAGLVIVLQRKSIRQEYAKKAGADFVFDPGEFNIPQEIRNLTGGLGVNAAFETTGSQLGFDTGLCSLKYDGTLVITSVWEKPITFNPNMVVFGEKNIVGTLGYRHEFPSTISLINQGSIKGDGYITKKIYLDDIISEGFGTLTGPEKKKHVKILVTPDQSLL